MNIIKAGSSPVVAGQADYFTGAVTIEARFQAPVPASVGGAIVTFAVAARTAWHTHPLGQTLIVLSGSGRAQRDGGAVEAIGPGDIVWFEPGERHWHGASPDSPMSHIAIAEAVNGLSVEWLDHVTDDQYHSAV